jgi:hypothetical protein
MPVAKKMNIDERICEEIQQESRLISVKPYIKREKN